jgi:antirestriction protein ArdC
VTVPESNDNITRVSDMLVQQLGHNAASWQQSWRAGSQFMPMNPVSGKPYRGINAISLATEAIDRAYHDNCWLTAGQATKLGGTIKVDHPVGSIGAAREELRTNLASLMLGDRLRIGWNPGNHAAYAKPWAELLTKDPTELLRASLSAESTCSAWNPAGAPRNSIRIKCSNSPARPLHSSSRTRSVRPL